MASDQQSPLYLGFDLSTQQLKAVIITSDLQVLHTVIYDFDAEAAADFGINKGVLTNEPEKEVFAPVALWLRAVDVVLERLKQAGLDFSRVQGISGAGQQHGSVYWNSDGESRLDGLDGSMTLEEQLLDAFAWPVSPNWQDASTQVQCEAFDAKLGGEEKLAEVTGSKAHHRFTGPQILRFREKHPAEYAATSRISLVSSFLASLFLGKVAPIDVADACGMNLWDVSQNQYSRDLLALTAGSNADETLSSLRSKIGDVHIDRDSSLGTISSYHVTRFKFPSTCQILPFTGDNPATVLSLPLRPYDAIISLGTSTTFLASTPFYRPDPAVHFMDHPTTPGLYMFMLCYKNGGLARENVRDGLPESTAPTISPSRTGTEEARTDDPWTLFNHLALSTTPLSGSTEGRLDSNDDARIADKESINISLFFPRPEIVPNVPAGTYRYTYSPATKTATRLPDRAINEADPRQILESQLLSLRLRSKAVVAPEPDSHPHTTTTITDQPPPQPGRIFLVGGGSHNPAIASLVGQVLGGKEGVWRLDVGGAACALGAAHKAVWGCEGRGRTFEEFVGERWRMEQFATKVDEGFRPEEYERYERGVDALRAAEEDLLGRVKGGGFGG